METIDFDSEVRRDYLDNFQPCDTLTVPAGNMLVAVERVELLAYARMLEVSLQSLEGWEYETRMDLVPSDAQKLVQRLRELAQR